MTERDGGVKENIRGGIKWGKKDEGGGNIGDHHHHASKFPPLKALFNYIMDLHSILVFPYPSLIILKEVKTISYRPLGWWICYKRRISKSL
jgi:hypothetical protein